MTISFKEILIIGAIIGALIWMRMARVSMEQNTSRFIRKLRGPGSEGNGFGWRGVVVAFVVGIVSCCLFGLAVLRIVSFYQKGG